jgi:tripartite-type tricarboxylate transporter receptor subunit TctC
MSQRICFLVIGLIIILLVGFDSARSASDDFFSGKTIRIVVGFTAGGSFDAYSRTLARHMGSHILGNPAFIVENMPGAGSLIVANHLYKVAKPDAVEGSSRCATIESFAREVMEPLSTLRGA